MSSRGSRIRTSSIDASSAVSAPPCHRRPRVDRWESGHTESGPEGRDLGAARAGRTAAAAAAVAMGGTEVTAAAVTDTVDTTVDRDRTGSYPGFRYRPVIDRACRVSHGERPDPRPLMADNLPGPVAIGTTRDSRRVLHMRIAEVKALWMEPGTAARFGAEVVPHGSIPTSRATATATHEAVVERDRDGTSEPIAIAIAIGMDKTEGTGAVGRTSLAGEVAVPSANENATASGSSAIVISTVGDDALRAFGRQTE